MPRPESSPPPAAAAGPGGAGMHGAGQQGPGQHDAGQHDAGPRWDALIVAGGRSRRLGGIDKTALVWRGRSLLDGVVAAASGAERTCVVGSDADLPDAVLRTVERPRWGGPAAAIAAGLAALAGDSRAGADAGSGENTDWVMVLAGDLVHADAAVALLLAELDRIGTAGATSTNTVAAPPVDGLISVDSDGRRQPLLAVYRRAALVASAGRQPADNLSVMSLIGSLTLREFRLPDDLGEDVDTPADAARLGIVVPAVTEPPRRPRAEQ